MSHDLRFRIEKLAGAEPTDVRRLTLMLGEVCLTRLVRRGNEVPDDSMEVPPLPFAFWIVDNWWRIRWEPAPFPKLNADWRLAHDLSSVGAGYAWPSVSLWGEGERFAVAVHGDSSNLTPTVQFLADEALHYLAAPTAERALDDFIRDVLSDVGETADGLDTEFGVLLSERADPEASTWRRLEAMLGFDPDDAPDAIVSSLETMAGRYGLEAVGEAALACQGGRSSETLGACLQAAERSRVALRPAGEVGAFGTGTVSPQPPWQHAATAAETLRDAWCVPSGPIRNTRLSELLGVATHDLRHVTPRSARLPYGLRLGDSKDGRVKVALRSRWPEGRRFELCRALADIVWAGDIGMGPLSDAKSERQKFQRAFAQAFLCPFSDLQAYIGATDPNDEDIQAAARHFHVSDRMIQTTLVNNGVIDRASFEQMIDAS